MRNSTPAQQSASRANGTSSRGPKTAEGKRTSSANSYRHGLLAKATVLENESRDAFRKMIREYEDRIGPRDAVERAAVEEMCSAGWRIRRLWEMERKVMDLEIDDCESPDECERTVKAFESLARYRPHFLLFHRYETRLHNIVRHALARIVTVRKMGIPNEPGNPLETNDLPVPENPATTPG